MSNNSKTQKLNKKVLASLARTNAEELMMDLCGKGFERAYNPSFASKRRRRRGRLTLALLPL